MHHRITWKLANCLGRLWHALDRRHRMIALRNLDLAFGDELSKEAKQSICVNTFIHLSCVFLELPGLFRLNENNLDQYITFSGTEHLYAVLEKGKGILVMASHFGNWELMSLAFSMRYRPFYVVMRPLDNPVLNKWVVHLRTRGGNETISKGESARRIIRLLRRGEAVALLVDQNVDWYEGVFVPFFKEIACTSKALATLALRTDSLVLSVYNYREPDGRYHMVIQPEVEITRSKDSAADVEQSTALFNRIIEGYVRSHPEQWFWLHQRWKTRPPQPISAPPNCHE
jgi:Kdo2-lipid IVA lauroyltransferase/acyltransferase